jgi:glucose/arabinose dehydrogenase
VPLFQNPRRPATLAFLSVFGLLIATAPNPTAAALPATITYKDFFGGKATFNKPLFFAEVPGKPGNYVILEQHTGNVIIATVSGETVTKSTMVTVKVGNSNEIGLLGFAFHPKFVENRKFYLSYNPTNDSTVVEERLADASLIKDAGSAPKVLLQFKQPYSNHNGGTLAFSPKDQYLYLGFGDGGSSGDPQGRSRLKDSFFSKMLRIDVDKAENGKNYGIPSDNPFIGQSSALPEIYAWGFRNPWKWSFDPLTGKLWVGDVGQGTREEIDTVAKGADMGWKITEGFICYPSGNTCDRSGQTPPIVDYPRSVGISVTGGMVYRANPSSPYYGAYFYADYQSRRVFAITLNSGHTAIADSIALPLVTEQPTSFGTDSKGNLFIVGQAGHIWQLESPDLTPNATKIKKLQKEKSIRCCMNQKGKRLQLHGTLDAGMLGLAVYNSQGEKIATHSAAEIRSGISMNLMTGVYLASAQGAGEQASVQFVVQ